MESDARTLGDAIRDYEKHFSVSIRPCTKPLQGQSEVKYFEFTDVGSGVLHYVDIHVLRGKEEICPRQDTHFILEPNDIVEMGELIC